MSDTLFDNIKSLTGATYSDCLYNKDLLDINYLRTAHDDGVRLPTGDTPEEWVYYGAWVADGRGGINENVVYLDLSSLYPSEILAFNASPETIIGDEGDLAQSQYTHDDVVWSYVDYRPVKHVNGAPKSEWWQYTDGEYKMVYDDDGGGYKWRDDPDYQRCYFVHPDEYTGLVTKEVEDLIDLKYQYEGDMYEAVKRVVNCYSSDTSVLTEDGVRNIRDLEVGDMVYSIDPETEEVSLKPVTETFAYPNYDGDMVSFEGESVDFTVTPNHKMVIRTQHNQYQDNSGYEMVDAEDISGKSAYWLPHDWEFDHGDQLSTFNLGDYVGCDIHAVPSLSGTSFRHWVDAEMEYEGSNRQTYKFDAGEFTNHEDGIRKHAAELLASDGEYARVPLEYDANRALQLIAWFVSEGNTTHHKKGSKTVTLTQCNDHGRARIELLLDRMGIDYSVNGSKSVRFTSAVWVSFFDGYCGSGAGNKTIPDFVFNCSESQKELFFETLMDGDGHWEYYEERSGTYTTKSIELRDDFSRLLVELGYSPRYTKVNGSWRISARPSNDTIRASRCKEETTVDDGVYCVEVADNHTLLAGRNGKFQFCGNSVYGFVSYGTETNSSRLYDWRIGEAITLAGRLIITFSAAQALHELHERGFGDAYVSHGDTDGVGISVPSASTRDSVLSATNEIAERLNEVHYPEFMHESFGVPRDRTHMEIEVESFSPRVFVPQRNPSDPTDDRGVKKRRGEWFTVVDGEEVDYIALIGVEAVRSNVATVTTEAQEHFFEEVCREGYVDAKDSVFKDLRDRHERIVAGEYTLSDMAKRGGIGQPLSEYGGPEQTPGPRYRGAKYANREIDGVTIREGDKPLVYYVEDVRGDLPSTYVADTKEDGELVDAIAVNDPRDLPDTVRLDYEKHAAKTLVEPMEPLIQTLGWSWTDILEGHEQTGLESFM